MSDWMMPPEAFAFLRRRLPRPRASIVELGSGDGTLQLRQMGDVVSIEHDPVWVRPDAPGGRYIHAPIKDGWYDPEAIRGRLPQWYDVLVIDGPPGAIGRLGLLKHLDLFRPVPLLVDDAHRPAEMELARCLAVSRKEHLSIHCLASGRAFATIGWGAL